MKWRILKTIIYRASTVIVQQSLSWIVFQRIEINAIFLGFEIIRLLHYYGFDWLWEKLMKKIGKAL